MKKKNTEHEIVELTEEELETLFLRVDQNTLNDEDKRLIKGAVRTNIWLRRAFEAGKITIHKLKTLLFGFRSEKRKQKEAEAEKGEDSDAEGEAPSLALTNNPTLFSPREHEKETRKGHGRLGADAYPHAEKVEIEHPTLKAGDPCPQACGGELYHIDPGIFIRVRGQNIAKVMRYELEKLRCNLCGLVIKADEPNEIKGGKYDFRFKSILAVQKYYGGFPFYRQEDFQKMLDFPLPDATQWDLAEQVANAVYPLIGALEIVAACGELIHNDDTPVRIVEVIRANKREPSRKRKGMFTTTIYARAGPYEIVLYYSGTKHAGENLSEILKKRPTHLAPIIHMSDALAANLTEEFLNLIAKCLAHGRRKFTEIELFFPHECTHVLNELGKVYHYDKETKEQNLSAEERLAYHQEHSGPVMEELKKWLNKQIEEHLVEPNSSLGKAIRYMQKHWEGLTLFLREAGCPLDNNICEQMIKIAIRLRKNSLIHKTCHGAHVASILMSLIQTCRLAGVNPVEYLTVCQENKSALFKAPSAWLPWKYKETLAEQNKDIQAIAA
jgi:transposase